MYLLEQYLLSQGEWFYRGNHQGHYKQNKAILSPLNGTVSQMGYCYAESSIAEMVTDLFSLPLISKSCVLL